MTFALGKNHPLWLAGFRPFFFFAIISGLLLPAVWGLYFTGKISLTLTNPILWHAHEMLYGFLGAVLIGFLLTASKNWVNQRGIHGLPLIALSFLWIAERFTILFISDLNTFFRHILLSLFIVGSSAYIIKTLLLGYKRDTYKDNYFFLIILILLILAKNLVISADYYNYGVELTVGLLRLAFVLMLHRTMVQFMKATESLILYQNKVLDRFILLLTLFCAFQWLLPKDISSILLFITGLLLFIRWVLWRPDIGFRKFGNFTMYLGYLGLTLHFFLEGFKLSEIWHHGTSSLHTFTFLCVGIIVPSMIVRISQGHTGRKPQFLFADKVSIILILLSSTIRILMPILSEINYPTLILISGILWTLAFFILGIRLIPFLFMPRVDGKIH